VVVWLSEAAGEDLPVETISMTARNRPETNPAQLCMITKLEGTAMLAEKFMLMLESLRKASDRGHVYADGAPKVVSASKLVPVELPRGN
jgi:hypothetical protein